MFLKPHKSFCYDFWLILFPSAFGIKEAKALGSKRPRRSAKIKIKQFLSMKVQGAKGT
jgi:hypothetical protein